jgi:hypothetical protein
MYFYSLRLLFGLKLDLSQGCSRCPGSDQGALRNKAVHGPDPEFDEGGARPAYSLDDNHDA